MNSLDLHKRSSKEECDRIMQKLNKILYNGKYNKY